MEWKIKFGSTAILQYQNTIIHIGKFDLLLWELKVAYENFGWSLLILQDSKNMISVFTPQAANFKMLKSHAATIYTLHLGKPFFHVLSYHRKPCEICIKHKNEIKNKCEFSLISVSSILFVLPSLWWAY